MALFLKQNNILNVCLFLLIMMGLAACSSTTGGPDGKPLPDMTFEHIEKLALNVAEIEINNNYDPDRHDRDVSIDFPVSPDMAVRRYAENRFEPMGTRGKFVFTLEDAKAEYRMTEPEGTFKRWLGVGRSEYYDVALSIRFYYVDGLKNESPHSLMTFKRSIKIPYEYTLAQKDLEQFKFVELLVQDVDLAITDTIKMKYPEILMPNTKASIQPAKMQSHMSYEGNDDLNDDVAGDQDADAAESNAENNAATEPVDLLTSPEMW